MFHIEIQIDDAFQTYFVKAKDYSQACDKLTKFVGSDHEFKLLGHYTKSELFADIMMRSK